MEEKGFIHNLLNRFATADGQLVAFSIYDGNQLADITYGQLLDDVLKAASYFAKHNIKKQHVAIIGSNSYDWIVTFLAISATGNTTVLLNQDLPLETLEEQCKYADVSIVCADSSVFEECAHKSCIKWVCFDELEVGTLFSQEMIYIWNPDETIVMMFTSGTTGKSKAVEFSAGNLESYLNDLDEIFNSDYDRVLLVAPLHHIMGLTSVFARFQRTYCVCIGRGVRYMISDMPVLNPMILQMAPTVLESIVKLLKKTESEEERQRYIGSNLKRISVGGAAVRLDLCRYMMEIGIVVETGYGMTETTGAGTWGIWDKSNIGTIGKPYGKTEIRIKDGELQMRGPAVMKGYYKDPEETARVIEDGWIQTGDMGYCDENGYYYITGRKKNVIILSNGENVNPEEIEAFLGRCPEILESLVYGDSKGICADIYTENRSVAAAYIREYNENMPMYRQVYKVNYSVGPLEKTASGKIKRKENVYV